MFLFWKKNLLLFLWTPHNDFIFFSNNNNKKNSFFYNFGKIKLINKKKKTREWYDAHSAIATCIICLSCTSIETLGLLYSEAFGGYSGFSMPISKKNETAIRYFGIPQLFLEDLPQLVLQLVIYIYIYVYTYIHIYYGYLFMINFFSYFIFVIVLNRTDLLHPWKKTKSFLSK